MMIIIITMSITIIIITTTITTTTIIIIINCFSSLLALIITGQMGKPAKAMEMAINADAVLEITIMGSKPASGTTRDELCRRYAPNASGAALVVYADVAIAGGAETGIGGAAIGRRRDEGRRIVRIVAKVGAAVCSLNHCGFIDGEMEMMMKRA